MADKSNFFSKFLRRIPFFGGSKPVVTVIELHGTIGVGGRRGLSLAKLEKAIDAAFSPGKLDAVALSINSPGGSPVQSRLIHDEIRRRAAEKEVPVLSFVEDVGASGGYILAIAGDEIFADESSIVGSIGVISGGFGFVEAIKRFGVERRVYTAGENKSTLDPFKPEAPEDLARMQTILDTLHDQFIDLVKSRRGDKLVEDAEIFSGAFWPAPNARERGLIDETGHLAHVLRERFGKEVRIKKCRPDGGSLLRRLLGGEARFDAAPSDAASTGLIDPGAVLDEIETRALWARFGL